MIRSFASQGTEDIYNGANSKAARKACPEAIWKVPRRKLDQLNRVATLGELRVPPGNELEALKDSRAGQHSIRINDQYRVCFQWTEGDPGGTADDDEIVAYHGERPGKR